MREEQGGVQGARWSRRGVRVEKGGEGALISNVCRWGRSSWGLEAWAPVGGGLLIGLPALAGDKSSVPGFVESE